MSAAVSITEKAVGFGPGRSLVGVLTRAETPPATADASDVRPAVVFLNAGILHRIGPNRIHVRLARQLAAAGHTCLRFDFAGTGDSPVATGGEGAKGYDERARGQTGAAMDYLATRGLGGERFAIVGLCSGADVGLAVTLEDERVVGGLLVNGRYLDPVADRPAFRDAEQRTLSRYYRSRALDPASWKRLVSGKSNLGALAGSLRSAVARRIGALGGDAAAGPAEPQVEVAGEPNRPAFDGDEWNAGSAETGRPSEPRFDRLLDRPMNLLLVASEGSISWDLERHILGPAAERLRAAGKLETDRLRRADHVFTQRWSQDWLCERAASWAARLPSGAS